VAAVLSILAALPYLPFFALPHISDDYIQIELGRRYGSPAGWPALLADPLYRCRATSILVTHWTEAWLGISSALFRAESVALHVLNTLLVAALGWWRVVGWRLSVLAAGFFAVHEGHQEAVAWYAALPELLVFFFALLCMHAWIRWHETGRAAWIGAAGAAYILALASKESAVAMVPILAAISLAAGAGWSRAARRAVPFALTAILYAWAVFAAGDSHLHLTDGTFSFGAPVWLVMARSVLRLLWVWGLLAIAWIAWRRWRELAGLAVAMAWVVVTLLPYAFLTYMPRVPSRHVYWASMGLGFVVASGLAAMPRRLAAAVAMVIVVHNCGYMWWRKLPQYERRAAATENLVTFAEKTSGPITVKCFPYGPEVAIRAVQMRDRGTRRVRWNPNALEGDGVYCDRTRP
jgi:hypothetical protein